MNQPTTQYNLYTKRTSEHLKLVVVAQGLWVICSFVPVILKWVFSLNGFFSSLTHPNPFSESCLYLNFLVPSLALCSVFDRELKSMLRVLGRKLPKTNDEKGEAKGDEKCTDGAGVAEAKDGSMNSHAESKQESKQGSESKPETNAGEGIKTVAIVGNFPHNHL